MIWDFINISWHIVHDIHYPPANVYSSMWSLPTMNVDHV